MADAAPDIGRLPDLIDALAERGYGTTITPIREGTRLGGIGSDITYAVEGWEIGYITGWGGDELAVGETLAQAVDAALQALEETHP